MTINTLGLASTPPANVHYGFTAAIADQRSKTLAAARAAHPDRFDHDDRSKILALPEAAWINQSKPPAKQPPNSRWYALT